MANLSDAFQESFGYSPADLLSVDISFITDVTGQESKVMNTICLRIVVWTLFLGGLFWNPSFASASAITDGLKATIDQVLNVVTDPKYQADKEKRRAKLRTIINPKFNYVEMGKRSLGKKWNDLSPGERKAFIDLFSKLLENSYANKIESYHDEQINYLDEIVKGKYAMVKTEVVRKNDAIGVDYKLLRNNGDWQVYDFIIEGVSMIRNYRSQFSKIIHQDSFQALMDKMSQKVKELEANNSQSQEL